MVIRWTVSALMEIETGFRRIQGCKDLPALLRALDEFDIDQEVKVA